MFKVLRDEIHQGSGNQTLIHDENNDQFYLISTVKYIKLIPEKGSEEITLDETIIFVSDNNGKVNNKDAVWGITPGDHELTLDGILNGEITIKDFDFGKTNYYEKYGSN